MLIQLVLASVVFDDITILGGKMRIMIFITGLGMGGAERQVCDLVDMFSKLDNDILVVSLAGEIVNRPVSSKVNVISLNMKKTPLGFILSYLKARKLIYSFKPDLVHSHLIHANIFTRLLRLSIPIPKLFCTAHSSNEGGWGRMLAYRLTDRLCDLTTNVSQEAVDISISRKAVSVKRVVAMHNGIDTGRFKFDAISRDKLRSELNIADDISIILAVGRLTAAKDYNNLVTAFNKLLSCKEALLIIIGTGVEEPNIRNLVDSFGLTDRVRFLGLRHDINDWMSAADIFVLSSAWEGFGLVVAEAMACERVVVATDCGGVKEVVGNAGILVPPKDSEALAAGIIEGLSLSPLVKQQLGRQARERVLKLFSLDAVTEKWIELYKK